MSMSLALHGIVQWFRTKNGWKENECGAQYDATPQLFEAGQFYVAVDDGGVGTGNETTDSLKEILDITIGIWRRSEHLSQRDRKGVLKDPIDKYLIGAYTLADLDRSVIVPKYNGLHNNYTFLTYLNSYFGLPNEDDGASFIRPLNYKGRGRMETFGVDDGGSVITWYGYRLRFRGLDREQKLRNTSHALG